MCIDGLAVVHDMWHPAGEWRAVILVGGDTSSLPMARGEHYEECYSISRTSDRQFEVFVMCYGANGRLVQ